MATIDALPDELLLMIFKLIPGYDLCVGAARVSRRWARVSRSYAVHLNVLPHLRRLRHCPKALLITVKLTNETLLLKRLESDLAPYLKELSIHGEMPLLDNELIILQGLLNLRHLDVFARSRLFGSQLLPVAKRLNSFVINETVSKGFLRALSGLNQLYAFNMYGNALCYMKLDMQFFLHGCANRLSELTLRCNEMNDFAYAVIGSCVNLKTLRLYTCLMMTHIGAMYLIRLQQLRCFHMTGARMIGSKVIGLLLNELPKSINELVLCGVSLGNEHVKTLAQRFPELHTLELCICNISPDALTKLIYLLPKLQYFDTDVTFTCRHKNIISTHPTLRKVRCLLKDDESTNGRVMFLPGDAKYKYALLRGDGQGYRADLFHYWSLRVPLEIIPGTKEVMGKSSFDPTCNEQPNVSVVSGK